MRNNIFGIHVSIPEGYFDLRARIYPGLVILAYLHIVLLTENSISSSLEATQISIDLISIYKGLNASSSGIVVFPIAIICFSYMIANLFYDSFLVLRKPLKDMNTTIKEIYSFAKNKSGYKWLEAIEKYIAKNSSNSKNYDGISPSKDMKLSAELVSDKTLLTFFLTIFLIANILDSSSTVPDCLNVFNFVNVWIIGCLIVNIKSVSKHRDEDFGKNNLMVK